MNTLDMAMEQGRAERETLRWVLLTALWHARPYGCSELVLWRTAGDIPLRVTLTDVRVNLDYLGKRGLVEIDQSGATWHAQLTALGEDVYDYRAECPAGVARPPRW